MTAQQRCTACNMVFTAAALAVHQQPRGDGQPWLCVHPEGNPAFAMISHGVYDLVRG